VHRNAPLTPEGRLRLCQLIDEDGWTVGAAAESMRISRQTAHKWWQRYQDAGVAGLEDRSSRPRRCPTKTPNRMERRIVELRRRHQLGPARLAPRIGMPASTFHRVLQRNGVSRLADLTRKGGRVIRRIETTNPGELVHVNVKKQAKIPKGGGWRMNGKEGNLKNGHAGRPRLGYAYIHSAIDAYSRLAYSEIHADERATTAIAFWRRAREFFASYAAPGPSPGGRGDPTPRPDSAPSAWSRGDVCSGYDPGPRQLPVGVERLRCRGEGGEPRQVGGPIPLRAVDGPRRGGSRGRGSPGRDRRCQGWGVGAPGR